MRSIHEFDLLGRSVIGNMTGRAVHTDGPLVIAASAPSTPETQRQAKYNSFCLAFEHVPGWIT